MVERVSSCTSSASSHGQPRRDGWETAPLHPRLRILDNPTEWSQWNRLGSPKQAQVLKNFNRDTMWQHVAPRDDGKPSTIAATQQHFHKLDPLKSTSPWHDGKVAMSCRFLLSIYLFKTYVTALDNFLHLHGGADKSAIICQVISESSHAHHLERGEKHHKSISKDLSCAQLLLETSLRYQWDPASHVLPHCWLVCNILMSAFRGYTIFEDSYYLVLHVQIVT